MIGSVEILFRLTGTYVSLNFLWSLFCGGGRAGGSRAPFFLLPGQAPDVFGISLEMLVASFWFGSALPPCNTSGRQIAGMSDYP